MKQFYIMQKLKQCIYNKNHHYDLKGIQYGIYKFVRRKNENYYHKQIFKLLILSMKSYVYFCFILNTNNT
jgi:hypothetical protein